MDDIIYNLIQACARSVLWPLGRSETNWYPTVTSIDPGLVAAAEILKDRPLLEYEVYYRNNVNAGYDLVHSGKGFGLFIDLRDEIFYEFNEGSHGGNETIRSMKSGDVVRVRFPDGTETIWVAKFIGWSPFGDAALC